MLTAELQQQLKAYFQYLVDPVVFRLDAGDDANGQKVREFVETVAGLDSRLSVEKASLKRQPSFTIDRAGHPASGIEFAGVPLGHEFESFVLALLQVSGHAPKITPEQQQAIDAIDQPLHFETYASLSCHNCPDVVQALDIISVLNPNVTHTMIEGGMFQAETEAHDIMRCRPFISMAKNGTMGAQISMRCWLKLLATMVLLLSLPPKRTVFTMC